MNSDLDIQLVADFTDQVAVRAIDFMLANQGSLPYRTVVRFSKRLVFKAELFNPSDWATRYTVVVFSAKNCIDLKQKFVIGRPYKALECQPDWVKEMPFRLGILAETDWTKRGFLKAPKGSWKYDGTLEHALVYSMKEYLEWFVKIRLSPQQYPATPWSDSSHSNHHIDWIMQAIDFVWNYPDRQPQYVGL